MDNVNEYFTTLYKNFNARKIDKLIAEMAPDVKWANGMEGGHVYGHAGVRDYWTRQFTMVSANVKPVTIKTEHGKVVIKVHQVVHDLEGKLLSDELVEHIFVIEHDKIAIFNIG